MVRIAIRSHQKLVAGSMYMDRRHLLKLSVLPTLLLLTPVDITLKSYHNIHVVDHSSAKTSIPTDHSDRHKLLQFDTKAGHLTQWSQWITTITLHPHPTRLDTWALAMTAPYSAMELAVITMVP